MGGVMAGKHTTGLQDQTIANAESGTETICDLLDIIKDLDERLDKAVRRLEENGIEAGDI